MSVEKLPRPDPYLKTEQSLSIFEVVQFHT